MDFSAGSNVDFVHARLHGAWAHFVRGAHLRKLADSTTPELLAEAMREYQLDATSRAQFQKSLFQRRMKWMDSFLRWLSNQQRDWYQLFYDQCWYDNLKIVLHLQTTHEEEHFRKFSDMVLTAPGAPAFKIPSANRAERRSTSAFLEELPLPAGVSAAQIAEIYQQMSRAKDFTVADVMLDALFLNHVYETLDQMKGEEAQFLRQITGDYVDILNLSALLRNALNYHFPLEQMKTIWIPKGSKLSLSRLEALCRLQDADRIINELPPHFHNTLQQFPSADFYLAEHALWDAFHHKLIHLFSDFNHPEYAIGIFPFLLQFESQNLGRVYEGVNFALPPDEIMNMMTGE